MRSSDLPAYPSSALCMFVRCPTHVFPSPVLVSFFFFPFPYAQRRVFPFVYPPLCVLRILFPPSRHPPWWGHPVGRYTAAPTCACHPHQTLVLPRSPTRSILPRPPPPPPFPSTLFHHVPLRRLQCRRHACGAVHHQKGKESAGGGRGSPCAVRAAATASGAATIASGVRITAQVGKAPSCAHFPNGIPLTPTSVLAEPPKQGPHWRSLHPSVPVDAPPRHHCRPGGHARSVDP